jgi:hypothetical protein
LQIFKINMNAVIKSSFWTDERLEETSPEIKLAVLWLITNPARDLCGFVKVSSKRFAFETGLPPSTLEGVSMALPSSIQKLSGGVYFLTHFLRHQFGKGGQLSTKNKVLVAAVRHAMGLPSPMLKAFSTAYPELVENPSEMIPHRSPIDPPCHGVRERERDRDIKEGGEGETNLPDVVALYPKREKVAEAIEALAVHVRKGADLDAVRSGTQAIAAAIARLPGAHLNAYVPSAAQFFRHRRWEDDPQTWLRNAGTHCNGAPQQTLDLGGRRPASHTLI